MKNKIGIATFIILVFAVGIFFALKDKKGEPKASPSPEVKGANVGVERSFGNPESKVVVVEFSDFQCSACANFAATAKKIREQYKDKIKFVFKHYILGKFPYSFTAAEASECAGDQGKFWEYEEVLFENSPNLKTNDLKKYAAELSLDTEKFNFCLENDTFSEKVEVDKKEGEDRGVSGTPTIFVNDKKIKGQTFLEFISSIQKAIDEELKKVGN